MVIYKMYKTKESEIIARPHFISILESIGEMILRHSDKLSMTPQKDISAAESHPFVLIMQQ